VSSTAFFIAALINFALFAAILVRLARRPVVSLFAERARRETDFLRREAHRVAREVRDRCYEESFESLVAALVADAEQGAGALDAERRRAVLTASADLLERGDAR